MGSAQSELLGANWSASAGGSKVSRVARVVSEADRQLLAALAARGIEVSGRQIERARQAGLLAAAGRHGLGRGTGSRSVRDADELERAVDAFRLLAEHRNYQRALIAMFLQGAHPIDETKLKAALTGRLGDALAWIDKNGRGAVSALDKALETAHWIAYRAAKSKLFRELRQRLKARYKPLRSVRTRAVSTAPMQLADLFADVLLVALAGHTTSPDSTRDMLAAFGVTDSLKNPFTGTGPEHQDIVSTFQERTSQLSFSRLIATIVHASPAQLERARDDTLNLIEFAKAYGDFLTRIKHSTIALAWRTISEPSVTAIGYIIPAMAVIREWQPAQLDNLLVAIDTWTPRYTAYSALLDTLPDQLIDDLMEQHGALTDQTATSLRNYLAHFETTHPNEYKTITGILNSPTVS